jgi:hypothetical protein
MQASVVTGKTVRIRRQLIGLLAASPLLLLQLLYLCDIDGWNVSLSYGLFFIAFPAAFIGLAGFMCVELWKRRRLLSAPFRLPWFSFGGLLFLITFFHFGDWARPIVLRVPQWCRVNQIIRWETSKPDEKYGGTHSYVLVFIGRGNEANHAFTSGYLNWTGDEPAGFADLDLKDQTFSHWVGYDHVTIPARISVLRDRIAKSGLPNEEVALISGEIWQAMDLALAGKTVEVAQGAVEPVRAAPYDYEDTMLGASVWMVMLIGSFQGIGRWSLPPTIQLAQPGTGGNR